MTALQVPSAPPQSPAEADPIVGFQLPRIEGHDRVAASIDAHAQTAELQLDLETYDPAAFDISQLGPRSRALVESSDVDNVIWLVHDPLPIRLYLYEGSTGAVWTRRLDPTEFDATAAEIVANVTIAIGIALQAGEIRDMEPVDPASLEPEPEPEPEPLWPSAHPAPVWIRLSYLGNTFSDEMRWQSAVALRLTWKVRPKVELWARYAYVATQAIELAGVDLDLRRHPITLGAGARLPLAPRIDVSVGGAATLDPVTRVLRSGTSGVASEGNGLRIYSSAAAYGGVGVHVAPRVRLALDVALDVLLTRADVVVRQGDMDVRHEPDRVRLAAGVGVEIGLGGSSRKD